MKYQISAPKSQGFSEKKKKKKNVNFMLFNVIIVPTTGLYKYSKGNMIG